MMKRLCAFDIETDRNGEALISGGWAVDTADAERPQNGVCYGKHVGDLIEQLSLADTLVGHNIIDFDLPFLLKRFPATMQAAITGKDLVHDLVRWTFEPSTLSTRAFGQGPQVFVDTMHKSKGNEFDDVILVGTDWLPITEDERRVWYVACTRARLRHRIGHATPRPCRWNLPARMSARPPTSRTSSRLQR
ncbi:MAG: ATP-binding domain-containing protein, partial [Candidatus Cryosericum sp.]